LNCLSDAGVSYGCGWHQQFVAADEIGSSPTNTSKIDSRIL
jgi:hypothetical protein